MLQKDQKMLQKVQSEYVKKAKGGYSLITFNSSTLSP